MKKSLIFETYRDFIEQLSDFLTDCAIFVDDIYSKVFHWNGIDFRTFNTPFLDISRRGHFEKFIRPKVCLFVSDLDHSWKDVVEVIKENLKIVKEVFVFTSYNKDLCKEKFNVLEEMYPEVSIHLKHPLCNYCCLSRNLFILPQVEYFPFIDDYSNDEENVSIQRYEDLYPKTQEEIKKLSHLLQDFVSSLDMNVDVFSIGPNSSLISEFWSRSGKDSRKGTLILIDRTVDMSAPFVFEDNLWDEIVRKRRDDDSSENKIEDFLTHDSSEKKMELLTTIITEKKRGSLMRLRTFMLHRLRNECNITFDIGQLSGLKIELQCEHLLNLYKKNKEKSSLKKKKNKKNKKKKEKKGDQSKNEYFVSFYEGIIKSLKREMTVSEKQCSGFKKMLLNGAGYNEVEEVLTTTIKNNPNLLEKEDIFELITLTYSVLPAMENEKNPLFPDIERSAQFRKAREDRRAFRRMRRINAQRKGFKVFKSMFDSSRNNTEYSCLVSQLMRHLCENNNEVFDDLKSPSKSIFENFGSLIWKSKEKVVADDSSVLIIFFVGGVTGLEVGALEEGFEDLRRKLCPNLQHLLVGSTSLCSKNHVKKIIHNKEKE